MPSSQDLLALIKEKDLHYVDFRFTDLKGVWHHVTFDVSNIDEEFFSEGIMFDGSSIVGWKHINDSDMLLLPDMSTAQCDPFFAGATLCVFCDVVEPETGAPYARDPRSIAKKAEDYLRKTGIADVAFMGPEAEFFIFDDVQFQTEPYALGFRFDASELPINNAQEYPAGNLGHRPRMKGGYFPVPPCDSGQDLRSEMLSSMKAMGVQVEKHHHEVAASQHELGIKFDHLLGAADSLQIYKYCVHQVARTYGKSATFMPKPVFGDNGSGLHVHQSLWKAGQPLFAGPAYAGLSQEALYYIGGIIYHARALNAFANPSTNSYKRLVPGYEAPVLLAYSARNRSAACRIPYTSRPKAKRVEVRFPDPSANPYLAFSAMLLAGLDGIKNKIDPGSAIDKDLYELPPEELKNIPSVAHNLGEALNALDRDRDFLKAGDVFSDDLIDTFINLKREEVRRLDITPHPVEMDMYYSV